MSALLLALAAGAAVGLALGALGGGGGILAVPALIYLLDFTPAAATTAALFIVATTSATALYAHARDGQVAWRTAALFSAAGVVPAYLAGAAAGDLPATALTVAFALVAAVAAVRMLRPARAAPVDRARPLQAAGVGAGLGAVTGFLGVGGGFLAVPALVGVLGVRMRQAIGTSLLVITVNALVALTARAGGGAGVDWAVVAPFTGAAVLAAWDGRRLAAKVSAVALRRIFAGVLLAVAAFMLVGTLV
ncbi:sulfite exporter TauE/SafE family protein [Streptomyces sp. OF3]|uniref:Probable membrane transporter protein n=1 Tax=Streptomyces alkaliterrae TaxID=2213162 RepID=A0A7W3WK74_9ACTN|nr:TSUP family transporter [Streptomyces alkaliterrae]MBB1253849.1 sulfite exporter TauE/SafE family protein [Streptomyces alkaliterrae]MBB1260219.1 sulfite exporter TauE/SafE family protein [Streptomyces alkaliterrae]